MAHQGVSKNFMITFELFLTKFIYDDRVKTYKFPSSLTSHERRYIHQTAQSFGLRTKSSGSGPNRSITIEKFDGQRIDSKESNFTLKRESKELIMALLQRYPPKNNERRDATLMKSGKNDHSLIKVTNTVSRLSDIIPQIPVVAHPSQEMMRCRHSLPIWAMKKEITSLIRESRVILITGDTGCGKTTQVPQFILEDYCERNEGCRIVGSEPRRLAALSVADRVAYERNESVGQTVGYQIRLESKLSPKSVLIFCTNGILLRTLMVGEEALNNITHIIIDEVHERDRYSDFLLLVLKKMMVRKPHLRLILMSATFDSKRFIDYFGICSMIEVPHNSFHVQPYFLEDVLKMTSYLTSQSQVASSRRDSKRKGKKNYGSSDNNKFLENKFGKSSSRKSLTDKVLYFEGRFEKALYDAYSKGSEDDFDELLSLIINDDYPVNYHHKKLGITALMVAAGKGKLSLVEILLGLGADISIRDSNDWNALDWARASNSDDVISFLESRYQESILEYHEPNVPTFTNCDEQFLIEAYYDNSPNNDIDIDLILELIRYICVSDNKENRTNGAILIFLPGYEEIISLKERLLGDPKSFDDGKFIVFTLHSQMQSADQKNVFKTPKDGKRKIILSTNLAETSVTIDDVVYVIDSGKVKEKSYDNLLGATMLKSTWISQANVIHRRGRAGRCQNGVCFHLFSRSQLSDMQKYQVPEILRIPIHQLALQTKLLAPKGSSIIDFLSQALDPPPISTLKNSIELLKSINALDADEELTDIGLHLLDLPIEPKLGKMVLNSIVLKCLDPVLTIVCSLAYQDPFVIPSDPSLKKCASDARKVFSDGTMSDHMALLRVFQAWQRSRSDGHEKIFATKNFIRSSTMEMIVGIRSQLLGLLRASGFVKTRGPGDIRNLNINSDNWAVVKAAICGGAYPNLIQYNHESRRWTTCREPKVSFHPSSTLYNPKSRHERGNRGRGTNELPSVWLCYEEMERIGRLSYARVCTLLHPIAILLLAGPVKLPANVLQKKETKKSYSVSSKIDSDSDNEEKLSKDLSILRIDDWISFRMEEDVASLILNLRSKLQDIFLKKIKYPGHVLSSQDEYVINTVVEVISLEEETLSLPLPKGIGQRPLSTTFCSYGNRNFR